MSGKSEHAKSKLQRNDAIEILTKRLWQKMEHIDPGDGDWDDQDEGTKQLFRHSVCFMLDAPRSIILSALL